MIKINPKIYIRNKFVDVLTESGSVVFLLLIYCLLLINWKYIPETICSHYDLYGKPDGTNSKMILLFTPIFSTVMYILLTVISKFPHTFNYPVEINPNNAEAQYRLAIRLMSVLKMLIIVFMLFVQCNLINCNLNHTELNILFPLIIFLISVFASIFYYFSKAKKNF